MGRRRLCRDAGRQGVVRPCGAAESRGDLQRRSPLPPLPFQTPAADRSPDRPLHRMRVLRGELPDVRADPLVAPAHRRAPRDRPAESLGGESASGERARTRLPLSRGADLRRGRTLLDELSGRDQYGGTDACTARPAGTARECGPCRRGVCRPPFRRVEKHPAPRADDGRCGAPGTRDADDDFRDEGTACAGTAAVAALDATGLPDAGCPAENACAGTGQGGLFPELHQPDDGSRPRNAGRGAAGRQDGRIAPQGGL